MADSVSYTIFHLILLFGGGCADIEEHNRPSKVVLAALLPPKRPQLTAFLYPRTAQMLQPVVTVDNGGLSLTFAYHRGKISPKAGIIKSL